MDRLHDEKHSTTEAAELLGVTGRQVIDLIREGELTAYGIGSKYVFRQSAGSHKPWPSNGLGWSDLGGAPSGCPAASNRGKGGH